MRRTADFDLKNYEARPAYRKTRAMTLKETSPKIKVLQRRHGYPPNKQDGAGPVKLKQAKRVCKDWV